MWNDRIWRKAIAEDTYISVILDNGILRRRPNFLRLVGAERMWQKYPDYIYEPISRLSGPRKAVEEALRNNINQIRQATKDQSLTVENLLRVVYSVETGVPEDNIPRSSRSQTRVAQNDEEESAPTTQQKLTPEEIGLDLDAVRANAYRRAELEDFISRINNFQRKTGQRLRLEKGRSGDMTDQILSYFNQATPEEHRPEELISPKAEPENPLYSLIRRLLSLNGFNKALFLEKCHKGRSPDSCQRIFEEGRNQYLRQPLERGKPVDKTVATYLDLTFLTEFSNSAAETAIFEKKQERILTALKKFDVENPAQFWLDYCQQYLEIEVHLDKAEFLVLLLDHNWQNNAYFSLDMIQYFTDNRILSAGLNKFINRTMDAPGTKNNTEVYNHILTVNRRFRLPQLEKPANNDLLKKDLSLILGSCFIETYYPTPEGLVAIPYNIDLAAVNLNQLELVEEYRPLLTQYKEEFIRINNTLSSFLYSLI